MATGAAVVLILALAGVILFDIFLLGKRFDRRIDTSDSEPRDYGYDKDPG